MGHIRQPLELLSPKASISAESLGMSPLLPPFEKRYLTDFEAIGDYYGDPVAHDGRWNYLTPNVGK